MLKAFQGFQFDKEIPNASSQMVLFDGLNKYVISEVTFQGEQLYLTASADETKEWIPGRYSYQVLDSNGIIEEGTIKVKANLMFSTDIDSYWKKALKAVEERIAGKTLDPANDVSVGDKRISYYRLDELLKLRDFILQKIAEEEQEEGDETAVSKSDQKRIIYAWRGY